MPHYATLLYSQKSATNERRAAEIFQKSQRRELSSFSLLQHMNNLQSAVIKVNEALPVKPWRGKRIECKNWSRAVGDKNLWKSQKLRIVLFT